ncbi:MAG: hypothetical protein Q7T74_01595, partial [Candidatus Saccharibacteria bacterium]|nr:hypothetical protein [Candidatus Saccharibacteria bacterium]
TIGTISDDNLTLAPNGTGNLILSSDFNTSVLVGNATTPAPLSISGGIGGNAALVVDQLNSGNIFAASASGTTVATLDSSGNYAIEGELSDLSGNTLSINDNLAVSGTSITLAAGGSIAPASAGSLTLGSGAATAITISTDGTGDSEFVLPGQSVSASEILSNTITATQLNATITFSDADFIDLSGVLHDDSAAQGIRLPVATAAPTDLTGQGGGFLAFNDTADTVMYWNGANWVTVAAGSGSSKFTEEATIIYPNNYGTKDFAIGGNTLAAVFSADVSSNTVRIGDGSGVIGSGDGTIALYANDDDTGSLTYNTSDQFQFAGGDVLISQDLLVPGLSTFGSSTQGEGLVTITGGNGSNAALVVNQANNGDILSASASGTTRFRVQNTGELVIADNNSTFFTTLDPATLTSDRTLTLPNESGTICIQGSTSCGFALGTNYFQLNNNLLSPINSTYDFAIGGTATSSAQFAVAGIASGAPVATLSATTNNNGLVLNAAASSLQSLRNNTLTLGGNTTGNIVLDAGSGLITLLDNTTINGNLAVTGTSITLAAGGSIAPSTAGAITLGSGTTTAINLTTDGTGDAEVVLPTGSISGTEVLDDTITLTTDTNGNYVATITAGNGISGSVSTEGSTPTIALSNLTADWDQQGGFDIVLNNASSELRILESSGGAFYGTLDVGDLSGDAIYTFSGASGTVWTSGNDGSGSGLDADLFDSLNSTQFLRSDTSDSFTSGVLSIATGTT